MELVVIGIDALSFETIAKNRFPALDGMKVSPLKSTIPYVTPPAWTTAWTGLNPSAHGILGIQSFIGSEDYVTAKRIPFVRDMPKFDKFRIWDFLSTKGKKCIVRDIPMSLPQFDTNADVGCSIYGEGAEAQWRGWEVKCVPEESRGRKVRQAKKDPHEFVAERRKEHLKLLEQDDCDVLFLGFNILDPVCHRFGNGNDYVQAVIMEMSEVVEAAKDYPMILFSDHGFETYERRFHLENFLSRHGFFEFGEDGPHFTNTIAYPVDCCKQKVTSQDFGIYMNTKDKSLGIVSDDTQDNYKVELVVLLSQVQDLEAYLGEAYYNPAGEFFSETPDILVSSNNNRTFVLSSYSDDRILEPWSGSTHSIKAVFTTNIDGFEVGSLEDIYGAISNHLGITPEYLTGNNVVSGKSVNMANVTKKLKDLGYFK